MLPRCLPSARSSSQGSAGSFHTANPIDSERSSLNGYSEFEGEEARGGTADMYHVRPEEEEGDTDGTLRSTPSPHQAIASRGSGREMDRERNWINQPKLLPAESETVPPCPEKRPLGIWLNDLVPSIDCHTPPYVLQRIHKCPVLLLKQHTIMRPHPSYNHLLSQMLPTITVVHVCVLYCNDIYIIMTYCT